MSKRERKPVVSPLAKAPKEDKAPKKPRVEKPKAQPSLAMIRLCRWLEGGSCLPNLKKMATALDIKNSCLKEVLIARIVEALEEKDLPDSFAPSQEDAALSDEAFNAKVMLA